MEACRCKWGAGGKMAEVQCSSLLVTERRTVRTIATTRHSPFISRHRQMKNHCESATSVGINITKPARGMREGERERHEVEKKKKKKKRGHSSCPLQMYPKSDQSTGFLTTFFLAFLFKMILFLLNFFYNFFCFLLILSRAHTPTYTAFTQDMLGENRCRST